MKPFECIGEDGAIYLHYDRWHDWRDANASAYPTPDGKYRFDIELAYPSDSLSQVPVDRNPHSFADLTARSCFYSCADWTTIFGVHDARHPSGESHRMVIENGHPDPCWGERIRVMSTSGAIEDESWGKNPANKFAYFRKKFWRVVNFEPMQGFTWGIGYPLTNHAAAWIYHPLSMPPEMLYRQIKNLNIYRPNPDIPSQEIGILYENANWGRARWEDDSGENYELGFCYFVVWRHTSSITGIHDFLSITSLPEHGFPALFVNLPDLTTGTLAAGSLPHTRFQLERIAPGIERPKAMQFRVLGTIGEPIPNNIPPLQGIA